MRKVEVPDYVIKNQKVANVREFKAKKRAEIRAAMQAVYALRAGCAYMPGYPQHINAIESHLEQWKQALSVKQWGR